MTVTFTSTPADTRPRLGDIIPALIAPRPGIDPNPRSAVLRALVRGQSAGYGSSAVRSYLRTRPNLPADLAVVVGDDRAWRSLAGEAKRWRAKSTPDRVRLSTARRLVARLVSPLPVDSRISPRMEVQLRIAYAVIAMRGLSLDHERPLDAVMVGGGWLGGLTNRTELIAGRQLRALRDLGWIRLVGRRNGTNVYRLARLETPELRAAAWAHAETVSALAEGRLADDYLATVIASVAAPAWHYSQDRLGGGRAWMRLVGHHVTPVERAGFLGLTRKSWAELGRELERELPGALAGELHLDAALVEYGETELGTFVALDRQRELAETAAANRARLLAFRAQRDEQHQARVEARRILHAVVEVAGPPPAGSERRDIESWTTSAARVLADRHLGDVDAFRGELTGMLDRLGWRADVVGKVVDYLARVSSLTG